MKTTTLGWRSAKSGAGGGGGVRSSPQPHTDPTAGDAMGWRQRAAQWVLPGARRFLDRVGVKLPPPPNPPPPPKKILLFQDKKWHLIRNCR